mmetsp:Transcript_67280/g.154160  ORF Transcript_67280/g.154160 Transcript_67280/m.154160 type:complete len:561 (+) Transcript_67280:118-1800(+)
MVLLQPAFKHPTVALCLAGQWRSFSADEVHLSLRNSLASAWQSDVAIFLAVDLPNTTDPKVGDALAALPPKRWAVSPSPIAPPSNCEVRWPAFLQYSKFRTCLSLIEEDEAASGERYDWVVRARFDHKFVQKLPPIGTFSPNCVHLRAANTSRVHVFRNVPHLHIDDQFAVVPRNFAESYFGIVDDACLNLSSGPQTWLRNRNAHEDWLLHRLRSRGVPLCHQTIGPDLMLQQMPPRVKDDADAYDMALRAVAEAHPSTQLLRPTWTGAGRGSLAGSDAISVLDTGLCLTFPARILSVKVIPGVTHVMVARPTHQPDLFWRIVGIQRIGSDEVDLAGYPGDCVGWRMLGRPAECNSCRTREVVSDIFLGDVVALGGTGLQSVGAVRWEYVHARELEPPGCFDGVSDIYGGLVRWVGLVVCDQQIYGPEGLHSAWPPLEGPHRRLPGDVVVRCCLPLRVGAPAFDERRHERLIGFCVMLTRRPETFLKRALRLSDLDGTQPEEMIAHLLATFPDVFCRTMGVETRHLWACASALVQFALPWAWILRSKDRQPEIDCQYSVS